jgi:hypothetical protein
MSHSRKLAFRFARPLAGISLALAALVLLVGPLAEAPASAEPAAQAQPSPSPRPRATATPIPTLTAEQKVLVEQKIQDLQRQKLEAELNWLERQEERLKQQRDIDRQAWRAPAGAIASFGPTLIGLGLLYLLARALNYWIPPQPASQAAGDEEEEEL